MADGTAYAFGLAKLHNSTLVSYLMTPSSTDAGQWVYRIQGVRNIVSPR